MYLKISFVRDIMNIVLADIDGMNEWSQIGVCNKSQCHVCGAKNRITLVTENSDGDNPWVAICNDCCIEIFSKADAKFNPKKNL